MDLSWGRSFERVYNYNSVMNNKSFRDILAWNGKVLHDNVCILELLFFFLSSSFERLWLRSRGGVFLAQQVVVVEEALVSSRSRARNAAQD